MIIIIVFKSRKCPSHLPRVQSKVRQHFNQFFKHVKTQRYEIHDDLKQRKAAQIWEAETRKHWDDEWLIIRRL